MDAEDSATSSNDEEQPKRIKIDQSTPSKNDASQSQYGTNMKSRNLTISLNEEIDEPDALTVKEKVRRDHQISDEIMQESQNMSTSKLQVNETPKGFFALDALATGLYPRAKTIRETNAPKVHAQESSDGLAKPPVFAKPEQEGLPKPPVVATQEALEKGLKMQGLPAPPEMIQPKKEEQKD